MTVYKKKLHVADMNIFACQLLDLRILELTHKHIIQSFEISVSIVEDWGKNSYVTLCTLYSEVIQHQ